MAFFPLSKIQKKEMARILRGNLPPEVLARLKTSAEADRRALEQAAADKSRALAEAEAAYKASLPERMKREQQERFLKNAEKFT